MLCKQSYWQYLWENISHDWCVTKALWKLEMVLEIGETSDPVLRSTDQFERSVVRNGNMKSQHELVRWAGSAFFWGGGLTFVKILYSPRNPGANLFNALGRLIAVGRPKLV